MKFCPNCKTNSIPADYVCLNCNVHFTYTKNKLISSIDYVILILLILSVGLFLCGLYPDLLTSLIKFLRYHLPL